MCRMFWGALRGCSAMTFFDMKLTTSFEVNFHTYLVELMKSLSLFFVWRNPPHLKCVTSFINSPHVRYLFWWHDQNCSKFNDFFLKFQGCWWNQISNLKPFYFIHLIIFWILQLKCKNQLNSSHGLKIHQIRKNTLIKFNFIFFPQGSRMHKFKIDQSNCFPQMLTDISLFSFNKHPENSMNQQFLCTLVVLNCIPLIFIRPASPHFSLKKIVLAPMTQYSREEIFSRQFSLQSEFFNFSTSKTNTRHNSLSYRYIPRLINLRY